MTKYFVTFILTIAVAAMANAATFTSKDDIDKTVIVTGRGVYTLHRAHVALTCSRPSPFPCAARVYICVNFIQIVVKLSWDDARRRCVSQNSTLAEIMSPNELKDLQFELTLIRDLDSAWVGGRGAQPGEYPRCSFFWNKNGDEITLPVDEYQGTCVPESPRHFLGVEIIATAPLKARHNTSILPYLCKL